MTWRPFCRGTSRITVPAMTRSAGCSRAAAGTRLTRTPSGTGGGAPVARPGCPALKLHDLRHFYASGLIAAGCDVVTVQRALGHRSATVTLNTYSHLWPTAEDRTRKAAAAMMAETLGVADPARTGISE